MQGLTVVDLSDQACLRSLSRTPLSKRHEVSEKR
jgi:hypothetical protein